MDSQKKLTWAFLLALVFHLTLLGLFALSALYKPKAELPQPESDIIHATIVEESNTPKKSKPVEKAKSVAEQKQEKEQAVATKKTEEDKAELLKQKAAEVAQAKAEAKKEANEKAQAEEKKT